MMDLRSNSVKYLAVASMMFSAGAAAGAPAFAWEGNSIRAIEDGGSAGVSWKESYRKTSGSYTFIVYRSANGGNQWKEVTYDPFGTIVKVRYGTF
ncbi:hypothetical protein HF072_05620 [Bacillus sp. RO3]|nr:hypothetical protein [Bacillus sp. RO3]